ncbi:hypothetical protein WA026_023412 [Henosepilachna vigintioctopunctata]|uniref:Uncharacterized protein n=1 Tax=Henosepilachna vigintioctopunctata TaxID=420089 RepID=A0AAW1TX39_9CUCU
MCKINQQISTSKRARPSNSTDREIATKMNKKSKAALPPVPARKDFTGHWPVFSEKRNMQNAYMSMEDGRKCPNAMPFSTTTSKI